MNQAESQPYSLQQADVLVYPLTDKKSPMPFTYARTIHFADTDAAGVVYFANVLVICHEAYEASLRASGIELRQFFSHKGAVVFPIIHTAVDFFQPLFCGDQLTIQLTPRLLRPERFEITYHVFNVMLPERSAAQGITQHICIQSAQRVPQALPQSMLNWLQQWST